MQTRSSSRLVSNPSSNPTPSTNLNLKGCNRRRSKQRIENFNLEELSPPIVTMPDQRTMAQLLQAPTKGYADAIVVPAITADNFELKHGAAWIWLEKEPPRYIFTWDDLFLKFINQFFHPSKTTNLRNEITNFQQRFNESFSEAWDRFKDLLQAYPHHGFSELHQLDTFYNALNSKDQDSLNFAAGSNFWDKMPRECLAIIESKSKVRYSRNKPIDTKVSTNTSTSGISPDVAELKDMVKALLLDKKSQNQSPAPVKAVEESFNYNQRNTSYRPSMMSNQIRPPGFPPVPNNQNVQRNNQSRFIPNQNQGNNFNQGPVYQPLVFQPPSYQALAYQALAPQTQGVSKEDFSAYVKANDAVMRNMQTQGQNMQNQLTNLTDLITKFMNSNSASTSSSGNLPSNIIANPRSDLKAITTRSGVSYDGPQILPSTSFLPKVVENEPEETKNVVNPTNNRNTEDVQLRWSVSASKPNPKTSIPYPSRRNDERNHKKANNQIEKFYQIFKDMSFKISFVDALILMPKFASTLKALIGNKEKLSEMAQTPLNEHCSAVLLKKLPEKLRDPSKFLIPCDFPSMAECLSLADLSASINLMPFLVWKRLSLPDLTPTCMTLELANRSISHPVGVTEDVYVKTGRALIDVFEGELILRVGNYLPEVYKELKICKAKSEKSSINEPPAVELKDLPPHLEYAFLEGDDNLPVIITKDLSVEEKTAFITVLKSHKRAIAWKLYDIKGIDPEFTHKILMEEDFEPAAQHQRRVNPKIHDVIKQEVIKLLEAGLIYPISNSPWVSPVHCVPKKGGFTVVENVDNELIPTRLVTGWRVCIDYRSGENHIHLPIRNVCLSLHAFGLCNAPGTFQRCEDINLCLNWEKSHFMVKEGIVLGHKISKQWIEVDKAKVDVITKLPHPTTVKGIRSFLGHAGFYCRFIKDFSKIARLMTRLLEKDTPFIFFQECIEAFQTLKIKLTKSPILIAPD
uniref:Reverse transcriptase domain-containing protein n=1 Tax=Tanacetum cinerariifolium TaxID=118510 RepID=A0A6L2NYU4_TANCI|nr:reverse transcriptase domain-containing protein [Tanacetum cinerariifolium]